LIKSSGSGSESKKVVSFDPDPDAEELTGFAPSCVIRGPGARGLILRGPVATAAVDKIPRLNI
jgi:hypothetical protein